MKDLRSNAAGATDKLSNEDIVNAVKAKLSSSDTVAKMEKHN